MLNKGLSILVCLLCSSSVFAGNFSYTYLGINIGKVSLDEDIVFVNNIYKELAYVSLIGSYQIKDNIVLSVVSSGMGNEGNNTELTYSFAECIVSIPISISEITDIVPFVGSRTDEVKACISNICSLDDESSMEYGAKLRTWVVPKSIELNLSFLDANSDGFDSEIGVGGAFMINENNRISIDYRDDDFTSLVSIGYRYNW